MKEFISRSKLLHKFNLECSTAEQRYVALIETPSEDVVERSKLKQLIECKYGDLDNICGCNVNGQWLSVAAIVELIDQAVKE